MNNTKIVYLDREIVDSIYLKTMEVSESSYVGVLNPSVLDSVLNNIQNDDYYPLFTDKLSHLFISITKFHCFKDGNKRCAIALSVAFLIYNGYSGVLGEFIELMENIVVLLAASVLKEEECISIIEAVISGEYSADERLRLIVINAMRKHDILVESFK